MDTCFSVQNTQNSGGEYGILYKARFKFQFVGMGRQPMRYALHPTNNCPAPLDPELLYNFPLVGGDSPWAIRARCAAYRYCPDPLGIVTAVQISACPLFESAQPATKSACHCEEAFMADVAISIKTRRYHVAYRTILRRKRRA